MTVVISFANQKGGVGKTTGAVNFAALAARILGPDQVVLLDLDQQGNASAAFLGNEIAMRGKPNFEDPTMAEVLQSDLSLIDAVRVVELPAIKWKQTIPASTLHIVPGTGYLKQLEGPLNQGINELETLAEKIAEIDGQYQLIVTDCPPNLSGLMANALVASDWVVIPITPGQFEIDGLTKLTQAMIRFQAKLNDRLGVIGVWPNKVRNTTLARNTFEAAVGIRDLAPQLYPFEKTLLPATFDRVAIGDAQSYQTDVMAHDPRSKSAGEFRVLAAEILRRAGLIS
ncbi:MAG: ParA family protein [Chloroflexota bacterium]